MLINLANVYLSIELRRVFEIEAIDGMGLIFIIKNISKQIEFAEQKIHPRLPAAKVEYYFKYYYIFEIFLFI